MGQLKNLEEPILEFQALTLSGLDMQFLESQQKLINDMSSQQLAKEPTLQPADIENHAKQVAIAEIQAADIENHAKQVALAEMTPLQDKMTERITAQTEEIERLKRITNMDAVWQSFAHVESLIKGLHARLDKLDCPKGNGRTGGS